VLLLLFGGCRVFVCMKVWCRILLMSLGGCLGLVLRVCSVLFFICWWLSWLMFVVLCKC